MKTKSMTKYNKNEIIIFLPLQVKVNVTITQKQCKQLNV